MTSTRNRNAKGDYSMEQRENNRLVDYKTYETYGVPNQTYLPGKCYKIYRRTNENNIYMHKVEASSSESKTSHQLQMD